MANTGRLDIQITAEDAQLRAVMKRAAEATTSAFEKMRASASRFQSVLGGLGVAAIGGSLVAFAKNTIDTAAAFDDLAEKTGASVENLSKLDQVARISGTGMNVVEGALIRLAKATAASDDATQGAAKAFAVLGLSQKELQRLDTAEALRVVALEMSRFADGAGKTALAMEIFGKSGAEALPFLKDLAEAGELNARITAQQAAEAESFTKAINKMIVDSQDAKRALVLNLLPSLQVIVQQLQSVTDGTNRAGDAKRTLTALFNGTAIAATVLHAGLKLVGLELGSIFARVEALKRLEILGVFSIGAQVREDQKRVIEDTKKFINDLLSADAKAQERQAALAKLSENMLDARDLRARKRQLDFTSDDAGRKDDPTKKILDNNLRALEALVAGEREILAERNRFLDLYNNEGLISFRDYFEGRRNALQENLLATNTLYDRGIAQLQDFIDRSDKATEKAEAQGRLNALLDKKVKVQQQASATVIELSIRERKAYDELGRRIDQINAAILESTGNLRAAAEIRFDQSTEQLRDRLEAEGNARALEALRIQRQQVLAQAELNQLAQQSSILADQRLNAETAIQLAQESGAIGELDSLRLRSEARAQQIRQLEEIYRQQLAIAEATGNPRLIQDVKNLGAQLEVLKSQADLVRKAFDDIFVGSFTDGLAAFLSGTKSAKAAFTDFVKSVEQQLARLAAQDISRSLFGAGGQNFGGTLVGWLAGLFGGGSSGPVQLSGPGAFAKGGVFDHSGVRRFALGGVVDGPTNFAFAGGMGLMGEAGPEAVMPLARDRSGRLGVRAAGGQAVHVTMNIQTPDANSFRQSESQIAAAMYRLLARSNRSR